MSKSKILFFAGLLVVSAAGFIIGQSVFDLQYEEPAERVYLRILEEPRKLAIPPLQQDKNRQFGMDDLRGKWSLLFFGYTNCPDVCPATLSVVAEARRNIADSGGVFPQVVFISIDPHRDNVDVLGEYVRYFDKEFIGITGEEKLLRAISVQTESTFMTEPSENISQYRVGHSLNLLLVNPEVELVAVLGAPHSVEGIKTMLEHFGL